MSLASETQPSDADTVAVARPALTPLTDKARTTERVVIDDDASLPDDLANYREFHGLAAVSLGVAVVALLSLPLINLFNPVAFAVLPLVAAGLGVRSLLTIRAYPQEYIGGRFAWAGIGLATGVLLGGWSWMGFVYATEVPEGYIRIDYRELRIDTETGRIPERAFELDGQKVFIKGYVYPGLKTHGIEQFVLCRDSGDCCFGGQPPLSDMIQVTLRDHVFLSYNQWQHKVWGTFRVGQGQANHDDLGLVLYHLDEAEFSQ